MITHKMPFILHRLPALAAVAVFFLLPLSTWGTTVALLLTTFLCFISPTHQPFLKATFRHPVFLAMLPFVLVALAGIVYTDAPTHDVLVSTKKILKILYFPVFLAVFLIDRRYILQTFLISACILFITGVLKFWFDLPIGTSYSQAAVFKSHIQTNFLVAFAAFTALIDSMGRSTREKYMRYVLFLLFSIYVWFFSEGRSGYITYVLMAVSTFWSLAKWRGLSSSVIGCVLIACFAYSQTHVFHHRIHELGTEYHRFLSGDVHTSLGERMGFARNTMEMIKDSPWIGFGTGSFTSTYRHYFQNDTPLATTNPHNEYLLITTQWGIIGLAAFFLILFAVIKMSQHLPLKERLLARNVILVIAVGSLFNSWFYDTTQGHFLILLLAYCFSATRLEDLHGKLSHLSYRHNL